MEIARSVCSNELVVWQELYDELLSGVSHQAKKGQTCTSMYVPGIGYMSCIESSHGCRGAAEFPELKYDELNVSSETSF